MSYRTSAISKSDVPGRNAARRKEFEELREAIRESEDHAIRVDFESSDEAAKAGNAWRAYAGDLKIKKSGATLFIFADEEEEEEDDDPQMEVVGSDMRY